MEGKNILGSEKIGKLLVKFAIPSIIAMLVNSLYNIVDQIFIGRSSAGYLGNGATNVVYVLTLLTMSLAMLLCEGSAALFSMKLGEGKSKDAAKVVGSMTVGVVSISAVVLVVCTAFLPQILRLLGATSVLMPYSLEYGRIVVFGIPLVMMSMAVNSLIRADGSPKFAMFAMVFGAVLNVGLDPLFIFTFNMGVRGAAIATVIGQAVSFLLSVSYYWRFKHVKLEKKCFKPDFKLLLRVMSLGISSFIEQISFALLMSVLNNLVVKYGAMTEYGSEIPLTAFGIAMKVESVVYSILLGIGLGMQPIVGYNYGAGNIKRAKKAFLYAAIAATAVSVASNILFVLFPDIPIGIFGSEQDPLYYKFSVKFFQTYFLLISFLGYFTVAGIFFQAVGSPWKAAICAFAYQMIFKIGFALIFAALLGLDGILWAGPVSEVLTAILATALLLLQLRQFKKRKFSSDQNPQVSDTLPE